MKKSNAGDFVSVVKIRGFESQRVQDSGPLVVCVVHMEVVATIGG